MLIDWFTVAAQVVNFVILVWLMKRFLYRPVQDAIAAREKRIADELAAADGRRSEADAAGADLARRSAAFDSERAALLDAARAAGEAQRQQLLEAARIEADGLTAKRRERLAVEAHELGDALQTRTREGVFAVARKALADLASTSLEASACAVFASRLRALQDPARADLAGALTASAGHAVVRSAFDLPPAQRAALTQAVDETFAMASTLTFETAPALVCGIELAAQGQKVSWNIASELAELQRGVAGLLAAEAAAPAPAPASVPLPVPVPVPVPVLPGGA